VDRLISKAIIAKSQSFPYWIRLWLF